jgi:hypothetical protein
MTVRVYQSDHHSRMGLLPPTIDIRSIMEYGVPYAGMGAMCSFCTRTDHLLVYREPWEGRALGHLLTRCPEHPRSRS